ncbi:hypothetical protein LXL04_024872 [Taraxacum kok-saghyz]
MGLNRNRERGGSRTAEACGLCTADVIVSFSRTHTLRLKINPLPPLEQYSDRYKSNMGERGSVSPAQGGGWPRFGTGGWEGSCYSFSGDIGLPP